MFRVSFSFWRFVHWFTAPIRTVNRFALRALAGTFTNTGRQKCHRKFCAGKCVLPGCLTPALPPPRSGPRKQSRVENRRGQNEDEDEKDRGPTQTQRGAATHGSKRETAHLGKGNASLQPVASRTRPAVDGYEQWAAGVLRLCQFWTVGRQAPGRKLFSRTPWGRSCFFAAARPK